MRRKQMDPFPSPRSTARPRVRRAYVADAGEGMAGYPYGAQFNCARCGWESGWICFDNTSEIRRGIPCPNCNPVEVDPSRPELTLVLRS